MVTVNMLRMLVDLSFFGAFGGLIAAGQGGTGALWGMLLQSLCFGLSCAAGKRRGLRLACLLPMALCWVGYRGSVADCILMIPTGLYIIWLVWREDYTLDQERQQRLFSLFWKIILPVILFGLALGEGRAVREITIPYTLIMLIGSVFLMRALRHEPEVYSGKTYQLINGGALLLVAAVGYAVSTKQVLEGIAALLKGIYQTAILPVFYLVIGLFMGILQLFSRLFQNLELAPKDSELAEGAGELDISELLKEVDSPGSLAELVRKMVVVLLICAGIALLVLFFRWLNGRYDRGGGERAKESALRLSIAPEERAPAAADSPAVRSIRSQYRKFIRLCIRKGMSFQPDTTSLDIDQYARHLPGPGTVSQQIRSVYLSARYGGRADRESVRAMKSLLARSQKGKEA